MIWALEQQYNVYLQDSLCGLRKLLSILYLRDFCKNILPLYLGQLLYVQD